MRTLLPAFKAALSIVALHVGFTVLGCNGEAAAPKPSPTVRAITVLPVSLALKIGQSARFVATVTADTGADRSVYWTSSNTSVAPIDANGVVTGVAAGSAIIRAATANGSVSGTAALSVAAPVSASLALWKILKLNGEDMDIAGVTGGMQVLLSIDPGDTELARAEVLIRTARGDTVVGSLPITPAMARNALAGAGPPPQINWDTDRRTASGAHVFPDGNYVLIARIADVAGVELARTSQAITMRNDADPTLSVVIVAPGSPELEQGSVLQLTATAYDRTNVIVNVPIQWSSEIPGRATVSATGVVSASSPGGDTGWVSIIATAPHDYRSSNGVHVVPPKSSPVQRVVISPDTTSVEVGHTVQFAATAYDANGRAVTGVACGWAVVPTSVATIDSRGSVTAQGAGTATVTATCGGVTGSSFLRVTTNPVPVASVSVAPASASLRVGDTLRFTATATDVSGNALTGRMVTWTSSNAAVVSISGSGLATAQGQGSASVTASVEGKTASSAVSVATGTATVASVTITPATATLNSFCTVQLTATVKDLQGNILANPSLQWSSANTSIATVSPAGLVTGVAAGSAGVTATSGGVSGQATITVKSAPPTPGVGPSC